MSGPPTLCSGLLWLSLTQSHWEDNTRVSEVAAQAHIFSLGLLALWAYLPYAGIVFVQHQVGLLVLDSAALCQEKQNVVLT